MTLWKMRLQLLKVVEAACNKLECEIPDLIKLTTKSVQSDLALVSH